MKNILFNIALLGTTSAKVSLGSLCLEEPCYGTSATAIERIDDNQPKYIRITDFDDFGIEENHKYMAAESYSSKHLLRKNDIIFARTGGTVGKTYALKHVETARMLFYFQTSDKCKSVPFDVSHLNYVPIVDSAEIKTSVKTRIENILEQARNGEI